MRQGVGAESSISRQNHTRARVGSILDDIAPNRTLITANTSMSEPKSQNTRPARSQEQTSRRASVAPSIPDGLLVSAQEQAITIKSLDNIQALDDEVEVENLESGGGFGQ